MPETRVINHTGSYASYPQLEPLPQLVRRQRGLEAKVAQLLKHQEDEKTCRGQIDQLLVAAGLAAGDTVTCDGFDVRHNERKGTRSLNEPMLVEMLVARGIDRPWLMGAIAQCERFGEASTFATVKPSKGAKVRK